jgi:TPR repeat protein
MLESGRGVEKDFVRAAALYRKGCEGGNASACYNLGNCYADGRGVSKEPAEAHRFYTRGCELGDEEACRLK